MTTYGSALALQSFILLIAYWRQNWELGLAAFFFGASVLFFPPWARLVERLWLGLGLTLARIVNPITLTLLFIFVIVPFGFFARTLRWLNPSFKSAGQGETESQLVVVKNCPSQKSFSKPF